MNYSIIFLIEEESEEFCDFLNLIQKILSGRGEFFEIIVVINRVVGYVRSQLCSGKNHVKSIKTIAFRRTVPQSVCLKCAIDASQGDKILIASAFQELSAESYIKIIDAMEDGIDVVVPFRRSRKDPFFNRLHSWFLNKLLRKVSGLELHDVGCQVKLLRREVLEGLEIYGNLIRYVTLIAAQKGFYIKEVECEQAQKVRQTRFYDFKAYIHRFIDIINLFFSTRFSKKPLRFFNLLGSSLIAIGTLILFFIGFQKVFYSISVGSRPLLIIGLISLVAGAQIGSFGLLAEIIAFIHGRYRKEYSIEKMI